MSRRVGTDMYNIGTGPQHVHYTIDGYKAEEREEISTCCACVVTWIEIQR